MTFPELLSALGIAPKNLAEAHHALAPAKQTLDSVSALFTAAGLDLDAMLAAGPDALKAHLDSLRASDAQLAEAQAKIATLETDLAASAANLTQAEAALAAAEAEFADDLDELVSVEEKARQLLAASGHAPLGEAPAESLTPPVAEARLTDQQKWDTYSKLRAENPAAAEEFFQTHLGKK